MVLELAEIDATMRNIPHSIGMICERWKKVVDVELLKEAGNCNISRLRTIVLVEADHNMNGKRLGRLAMQNA